MEGVPQIFADFSKRLEEIYVVNTSKKHIPQGSWNGDWIWLGHLEMAWCLSWLPDGISSTSCWTATGPKVGLETLTALRSIGAFQAGSLGTCWGNFMFPFLGPGFGDFQSLISGFVLGCSWQTWCHGKPHFKCIISSEVLYSTSLCFFDQQWFSTIYQAHCPYGIHVSLCFSKCFSHLVP